MLLFFSSLILVMMFAFFAANLLDSKNPTGNILCFLLAGFANVVLTFEILSLFSGINEINVIILNVVFALAACVLWNIKGRPVIQINLKDVFAKLLRAFKLDKTLAVLFAGFVFACAVSFILASFLPSIDIDTTTYHVVRSLFWIDNGSLNHVPSAEARITMFPINSEILYAWFMLFLKKDLWLGFINFAGVILFITALYGIMSEITKSLRKKLWVILITLSFPFAAVRLIGTETCLSISALILSTIYFYIRFIRYNRISSCFMAGLALALGAGTKTTVLLFMPALFVWCIWYGLYMGKKDFYKQILWFACSFVVCFVIFASYNYVLNFLNYGNFLAAPNIAIAHSNTDGILSVPSNLYRYIFNFFAWPEFLWSAELSSRILSLRDVVLEALNLDIGAGYTTAMYKFVPHTVSSADSAFGIEGVLLFLPVLILAVYKSFKCKNSKTVLIASFEYLFLLAVVIMAYKLAFMSFNIRFFMTFALVASPVIYYSYSKKYTFYKILITGISFVYFVYVSTSVSLYPMKVVAKWIMAKAPVEVMREVGECSFFPKKVDFENYKMRDISCFIRRKIKTYDNRNKILYFSKMDDSLMPIKRLMFEGYNIDVNLAAEAENINFNDYNIIITRDDVQESSTVLSIHELDNLGYYFYNGILCDYIGYDEKHLERVDGIMPAKSKCYFNDSFAKMNNLRLIKKYQFQIKSGDKQPEVKTYKFFENLDNPLIRPNVGAAALQKDSGK